jgi:ribosome maturation protein SDO1
VPSVFTNVSRGIHARAADLLEAFGTDDSLKCAMVILDKGEFEAGELERAAQYDALFRDIAATVAEKCINPTTRRPYPLAFVEKALRDVHFSVVPTKTAKQQALKAIASLRAKKALPSEMTELIRFAASERYLQLRNRNLPRR